MSSPGLTVLVADFDLMSGAGDHCAIYRQLFERSSGVHFTYLRDAEPEAFDRPSNVTAVPCSYADQRTDPQTTDEEIWDQAYAGSEFVAEAVGSQTYDVLEIPSHQVRFLFLSEALRRRGAKIGKIVAAFFEEHASSIQARWDLSAVDQQIRDQLRVLKRLLYTSADARYGISRDHLDDWKKDCPLTSDYLSPLSLFDSIAAAAAPPPLAASASRPGICGIGRQDRRRGLDLFLEMLWRIPQSAYSRASIFDDRIEGANAVRNVSLQTMVRSRDLEVAIHDSLVDGQLPEVLNGGSLVFAAPRSDTLDIMALRSVLSGCPTMISDGSGLCRLFEEELPGVPFARFDLKNSLANAQRARELLDNFAATRDMIFQHLTSRSSTDAAAVMTTIYQPGTEFNPAARQALKERYVKQLKSYRESKPGRLRRMTTTIRERVSPRAVAQRLRERDLTWIVASYHARRLRQKVSQSIPSTSAERRHVIAILENAVGGERFGRAWIWSMLSALELADGRDLVGASYLMRTMRLVGSGSPAQLQTVTGILRKHGFVQEAGLVEIMYGRWTPERRHAHLLSWLHERQERFETNPGTTYVRVDDRRSEAEPRVAVVVSLYNAASKMTHFLDAIYRQTLFATGQAELILVDSGSPQDEYAPIAAHPGFSKYPSVYVRTERRETIQQAWNRGVSLVRAPYVTMLGADETILPECLETLAGELDRRPDLDWIQSNWLVTETDADGNYDYDDGYSDRAGYRPELVPLDPTNLSWVGALYRTNMHDRFGYYDPTFKAQGDNEFKLRMLPYVKTDAYLRTFGIYWNFPELRVTQYPASEIEGYRAWHVFRTSAGVEYAHRNSSPAHIVECAGLALGYRRTYFQVASTDLEYACELLRYATRRDPTCFPHPLLRQLEQSLADFRELDLASWPNSRSMYWSCRLIFSRLRRLNKELAKQFPNRPQLTYFNDERCEHINWCWSYLPPATPAVTASPTPD